MARPLRIEYQDAWYHVMNRGRRAENVFLDKQDYLLFTELLKETSAFLGADQVNGLKISNISDKSSLS